MAETPHRQTYVVGSNPIPPTLADKRLGDLRGSMVEIRGLNSGITRFASVMGQISRRLQPLQRLGQQMQQLGIRVLWLKDIGRADADLPHAFVERTNEFCERQIVHYTEVVSAYKLATEGYWSRVGSRRVDGRTRIRGPNGKFRRDGNAHIIACLLRTKDIQNLSITSPNRSQIKAIAEAFNESPNVIKKAWNQPWRSKRKYRRRVKAQSDNYNIIIDLERLGHK